MRAVWSLCFTIPRNEGTYQENPTVVNSHSWFDQPLPLPDTAQNAFLDHEISQDVKIHLEQGSHLEKLAFLPRLTLRNPLVLVWLYTLRLLRKFSGCNLGAALTP